MHIHIQIVNTQAQADARKRITLHPIHAEHTIHLDTAVSTRSNAHTATTNRLMVRVVCNRTPKPKVYTYMNGYILRAGTPVK